MKTGDKNLKTAIIITTSIALVALVVSVGMLGIVENPTGFIEKLFVTLFVRLIEKLFGVIKNEIKNQ